MSLPGITPPTPDAYRQGYEQHDVMEIHAAVMREQAEPSEGRQPIAVWLMSSFGMLALFAGYYLGRYNGGFKALVFDENARGLPVMAVAPQGQVDMVALGGRTFNAMCAPCHQPTGLGLPGQFPPLAGGDLINAAGDARVIRIVLDGFTGPVTVNGQGFNGTMPPWRDSLSDLQIAAVLTYERQSWGNKSPPVSEETVKKIRDETKDHANKAWTVDLLNAAPERE